MKRIHPIIFPDGTVHRLYIIPSCHAEPGPDLVS